MHMLRLATTATLTPGTELPEDFVATSDNAYLMRLGLRQDGDVLIIMEYAFTDTDPEGVQTLQYTVLDYIPASGGHPATIHDVLACGTFPAPADIALHDDHLHRFAAEHTYSPELDQIPTADQVAAMLAPGGLDRSVMNSPLGAYAFEVLYKQVYNTRCPHRYRLTDSCPSC